MWWYVCVWKSILCSGPLPTYYYYSRKQLWTPLNKFPVCLFIQKLERVRIFTNIEIDKVVFGRAHSEYEKGFYGTHFALNNDKRDKEQRIRGGGITGYKLYFSHLSRWTWIWTDWLLWKLAESGVFRRQVLSRPSDRVKCGNWDEMCDEIFEVKRIFLSH